jgi:lycopene beta-cyclase
LKTDDSYDYIIAGAGCAGLSLAVHMIQSGKFQNKKILLIDQDPKKSNDRTWCFWEKGTGIFEPIVQHQWTKLWFHSKEYSSQLDIAPYRYKMIRGIDFYNHCFNLIGQQSNFTILYEKVDAVFSEIQTGVVVKGRKLFSEFVFNSILFTKPALHNKDYWLLQHFKGWMIETKDPVFHADSATLMDFRIDQKNETAFCYVLPLSPSKALVEYTLFSSSLLADGEYEKGITEYLKDILKIESYTVTEEEFGVIPMTNYKFPTANNNVVNIGTAGGQTKGSTGYSFNSIQKHSAALVREMMVSGKPFIATASKRFLFYDSILLRILEKKTVPGNKIFTDLFKKNSPQTIFRFLDNQSSLAEEFKIISSLPTMPFLKAAVQHGI